MPPTAARRRHAHRAPASRHHRRVSGPARPVVRSAPAVALPAPRRRGHTGVFERLRALPEHRMVDRLLRGRVWIWLIAIMLGGIVTMQVSMLKLNAGISHDVEVSGTLERVNADLETEVARLSAGDRIQQTATDEGMVTPPAGDVGYLRARPGTDPRLAASRMESPSDSAQQVMANGGRAAPEIVPGTVVAPAVVTTTVQAAPVATPVPTAAATPAVVPTATSVPTATTVAPPATGTGTGATTAPTG
jgi:hypothetical protein